MNILKFDRMKLVGIILTILAAMIPLQMVRIQTSAQAIELEEDLAEQYDTTTRIIYPERGNIYDRWGHLLAGNKQVYDVGIALDQITDPETVSMVLAGLLDMNLNDVSALANLPYVKGQSEYATVASNVSAEKEREWADIVQKYKDAPARKDGTKPSLDGVYWVGNLQRTYPEEALAANVIGYHPYYQGMSALGESGIEEQYNDIMAGTPVTIEIPSDPKNIVEIPPVPPGASLVLTIDREIQAMVERVLDQHIESSGAQSGTAIVMDPETGEILAMATTPRINLNEYWEAGNVFEGNTPYNRVVSQTYEPGSIFKVITMASALDAGVVTPDTVFVDSGYINVGGAPIYNWDRSAYGPQTMTGCMQYSLNVCLAWVATEVGPTRYYQYLQAFGITHRTNIDLADEQIFPLRMPGDTYWQMSDLGTNSFGQSVSITPIQMITAVSAIANDGNMMAPHMVRAVIQDGKQREINPMIIGTPVSANTAHTLTEMLAQSLEGETSSIHIEGYRLAGKTGTAQVPMVGGYKETATNASFIGWGPADDPQFIVFVWLEEPTSSPWGSVVAAPLFSDIVQELVVLINLPPDHIRQQIR